MATARAVRRGQPTGSEAKFLNPPSRYRRCVAALLFLALMLSGGASRADEPLQIVARLACIAALLATAWPMQKAPVALPREWRWFGLLAYFLVLVQLLPLPPSLWGALPGHAVYMAIASASGAVAWRPLSITPDLTLNALFALLPATAAVVVCLYLDTNGRAQLWWCLVGAALLSVCLGLVQVGAGGSAFRLYRETSANSAVGIFANRNHQAAFLACALPPLGALVGLRLRQHGRARSLGIAAWPAALLLLGDVLTGSRAGLVLGLAGAAGGLLAFRAAGARLAVSRNKRRLAIVAAIMAALVLAAAAPHFAAVDRLRDTDPAAESRFQMLGPLLRTAAAFFPFGSGFGSFETVYKQFEPDALLSTIYMNEAHNEPLQLAIEGGLPALLLLGMFLWWWVATASRAVRTELPSSRRALAVSAISVSAILMAESLIDYPLRTPLLASVFALACFEIARAAGYRPRSTGALRRQQA